MLYNSPLVWLGVWCTPAGHILNAFHVWDKDGLWKGSYATYNRARAEAKLLD